MRGIRGQEGSMGCYRKVYGCSSPVLLRSQRSRAARVREQLPTPSGSCRRSAFAASPGTCEGGGRRPEGRPRRLPEPSAACGGGGGRARPVRCRPRGARAVKAPGPRRARSPAPPTGASELRGTGPVRRLLFPFEAGKQRVEGRLGLWRPVAPRPRER